MSLIEWNDFEKIDIRVGCIVRAEDFPEARKPAIKIWVDFGEELGIRKSSAQITQHHKIEALIGQQILAVVNFPPRQIGKFMSEFLTLAMPGDDGEPVLIRPSQDVPIGGRLF
jgi:tRNA-binding protein